MSKLRVARPRYWGPDGGSWPRCSMSRAFILQQGFNVKMHAQTIGSRTVRVTATLLNEIDEPIATESVYGTQREFFRGDLNRRLLYRYVRRVDKAYQEKMMKSVLRQASLLRHWRKRR